MYMGDKPKTRSDKELLNDIYAIALANVPMRNEIVTQMVKQCNGNPKK